MLQRSWCVLHLSSERSLVRVRLRLGYAIYPSTKSAATWIPRVDIWMPRGCYVVTRDNTLLPRRCHVALTVDLLTSTMTYEVRGGRQSLIRGGRLQDGWPMRRRHVYAGSDDAGCQNAFSRLLKGNKCQSLTSLLAGQYSHKIQLPIRPTKGGALSQSRLRMDHGAKHDACRFKHLLLDFSDSESHNSKVQQSCQYHGLPGDDANKHIDKFLTVTQSMKQNGVPHDVLRLCLFPYSLTHHAIAWFDHLPQNSIHSWEEMVTKFLSKYFPPSMVTKLRNYISNFRQLPDESLNEAWDRYKLSIDRCPNHNMLPGALPSNIIPNPREDIKVIPTRSSITLAGPSIPPPNSSSSSKEVERDPETTMDQMHISSSESTARVPSLVIQPAPVSKSNEIPERNPHQPPIPYPSRLNKDKLQDKSDIQIHKFLQMFKKLHFNISFAEALAKMPKHAKMLKDLLTNKKKLLELANTPPNENCLAVLLKKLPEKLGDPEKFLIPCNFSELGGCLALPDLGASINLMPLSVWKNLMLHELIPTRMTLELANRSVAYPVGIAEDVFVQVELILRVGDEKLIFNVESTSKYPHKHGDESINQIDIIDTTSEDHFHEVLNVQKSILPLSGNPTPSSDPSVTSLFPSVTSFEDIDSLLEETDTFLALDSIPTDIDNRIYDSEGDIFFHEK
ncbi:reverse transcriptase domain-containing protein [Tanacetum coccineum]